MVESESNLKEGNSSPAQKHIQRVIIWPGYAVGSKWISIAKEIAARTDATFSLLCSMPQTKVELKKNWAELTSDIEEIETLFAKLVKEPDGPSEPIEKAAREYEKRYGVPMTEFLQSDRHLGIGYCVGGQLHHKSWLMERANYAFSLRIIMALLDYFEDYLEKRNPGLILMEGVSSLRAKCLAVTAHRRNIPFRIPITRYENEFYWGANEYYESPWLQRRYEELPVPTDVTEPVKLHGPNLSSEIELRRIRRQFTLSGLIKRCVWQIAVTVYQKLIRFNRPHGYRLSEKLSYLIRAYQRHRKWEQSSIQDISELKNKDYVFFPLQTEPESSLMVQSPEFNHQAAIIDIIAKSLPAGVKLAIKEHEMAAIASRPPGFMEWLCRIPNVVLVSMHIKGVIVTEYARAVVTVTGTTGLEAAVMGVPVISFGRHNVYNCVTHVHYADTFSEIRPLISRILSDNSEQSRKSRIQEGHRFFKAMRDCSADLGDDEFYTIGSKIGEEKVSRLVSSLLATLTQEALEGYPAKPQEFESLEDGGENEEVAATQVQS